MEEIMLLTRKVRAVSWRIRCVRAIESALRFLMVGLIVDILLLVIGKVIGPFSFQFRILVLVMLASVVSGILYGSLRPLNRIKVARLLDQKLNLRERVGTAVELANLREREWSKAIARDALASLGDYRLGKVKFRSPSRGIKILPILGAILLIVYLLPSFPTWNLLFSSRTETLTEEGQRLGEIVSSLRERTPQQEWNESRELLSQLENLSQEMLREEVSRKEVLEKLSALSSAAQMRQQALEGLNISGQGGEENVPSSLPEEENRYRVALEKIKQLLPKIEGGSTNSGLEKEIEELSQELPPGDNFRESLEEASQSLKEGKAEQAAETLRQMEEELKKSLPFQQESQLLDELQAEIEKTEEQLQVEEEYTGATSKEDAIPSEMVPKNLTAEGLAPGSIPGKEPSTHPEGLPTQRLPSTGPDVRIPGKLPSQPEASFKIYLPGGESDTNSGYYFQEIYPRYRKVAEETLIRESIPPGFRQYVKEYFQSLEPR